MVREPTWLPAARAIGHRRGSSALSRVLGQMRRPKKGEWNESSYERGAIMRRRLGEPTLEIHASIVGSVAGGAPLMTAAWTAGVDAATFHEWINEGRRNPDGPCGRLRRDVRAAAARCFGDVLESIRRAAKRNKWAAAGLRKEGDSAAAVLRDLEDPEGEDYL